MTPDDLINSPNHYQSTNSKMEVIDVIEAFDLNFHLGNSIKYILRAGKKGAKSTDLQKAIWYLERESTNLQRAICCLKRELIAEETI